MTTVNLKTGRFDNKDSAVIMSSVRKAFSFLAYTNDDEC